jgi:hypothetical protein
MKNKFGVVFLILPVIIVGLFIQGCTENPFKSDNVSSGSSQISGKIRLSGSNSPEDVYIWLEGFNVGTRSNASGDFELTLPPSSVQGTPGNAGGSFNIYFYVANYRLDSVKVIVKNGQFVYSQGNINEKGQLLQPVFLRELVQISTTVFPASVSNDPDGLIKANVTLEAKTDSVTIYFPSVVNGLLAPVIFQNTGTNEIFIMETTISGIQLYEKVTLNQSESMVREYWINIGRGRRITAGTYIIIPYLLIRHEPIPGALIESLGENVNQLGPDYLNVPFKRIGGQLNVFVSSDSSNNSASFIP